MNTDTIVELVARAYAQGFRDGWAQPDRMVVPDELIALAEHQERMFALRHARRVAGAPYGSYVHHLDGDPHNNDLGNLVIIPPHTSED